MRGVVTGIMSWLLCHPNPRHPPPIQATHTSTTWKVFTSHLKHHCARLHIREPLVGRDIYIVLKLTCSPPPPVALGWSGCSITPTGPTNTTRLSSAPPSAAAPQKLSQPNRCLSWCTSLHGHAGHHLNHGLLLLLLLLLLPRERGSGRRGGRQTRGHRECRMR